MLTSIINGTIGVFISSLVLVSSGSLVPVENKTKSDSQEVTVEPVKKTYTRYYSVLTTPGNWTWTDQEPENMACGPNPAETYCFIDSDVVPQDNDVPSDDHIDSYGLENSSYQ